MKKNKLKIIGFYLIATATIFGVSETVYFGNNFYPQSHAEEICDAISLIINFTGVGIYISTFIDSTTIK